MKADGGALGDLSKILDKILQAKPAAEIRADAASIVQKIASKGLAGPGASPEDAYSQAAKAMFIHALTEAADEAARKQFFNLETAINDLWIKLDPIRNLR